MTRLSKAFILLVGAFALVNCSKSSSGTNGTLAFDKASYTAMSGSTIGVVITLSGSSEASGVTVTIASDTNTVAVPLTTSCHLSDAAGAISSCTIQLKGLALGTANITASAPGVASGSATVTTSASPGAGTLAFSAASEYVVAGSTQQVTLALNHSSGVSGLNVTVTSLNQAAATVSPTTCILSTAQPSQVVTISGVAAGTASIVAGATGYVNATNSVTTQASGTLPGTLSFGGNVPVPVGGTQTGTLNLVGSSGVASFIATLSAANALATIPTTPCTLSTASPTCNFTITGMSAGNDPITATASGYTSPSMVAVVGGGPTPGKLVFAQASTSVVLGSTTTASLSLAGSIGVTSVVATLTPSTGISIPSTTCTLTPGTPCVVTITGGVVGTAETLTARATGYGSVVENVTVLPGGNVVYGSLEFTTPNLALLPGTSAPMTLQLVDSSNVSNLAVAISGTPAGLVTFNPTSCSLSTANNSCTVNVTANATAGTATVSTAATGPSVQGAAAVTVDSNAPPTMFFSNPNPVVIAQGNTNNVPALLTMTNVPAVGITVNLGWPPGTPATMNNSPGTCSFTTATPTCSVNVVHGSTTDPVGGPYNFVASVPGGSIAPATLPVYIAALTPVDRTLTVVNNCGQTVYAGISGGAVGMLRPTLPPCAAGWSQVTPGGSCCPTGSSPGDPYCYWTNPTPSNGYQLTAGKSTQFLIPGTSFGGSFGGWNGNVMGRLGCSDPSGCNIGGCTGASPDPGNACAVGNSFANPQTMAEFTLQSGLVDTYDVTIINGVTLPTTMGPTGLTPDPSTPYTNGVAGGMGAQVGSQYALFPANWSFSPQVVDPTIAGIYYNLVTPAVPAAPCSTSSPCTAPQQVCGYTLASISQPTASYAQVCGTRIAYLTAAAIWSLNPDTTASPTATPFAFTSYPGTSTHKGHTLLLCPTPPMQSGYDSQAAADTCGCTEWTGIATPVVFPSAPTTCSTINPNWTSYALPKVTWLKMGCPTCYTYQYDDISSTFQGFSTVSLTNAANGTNYTITFCPNGASVPPY